MDDDPAYENFRNLALIAAETGQDTPLTEESKSILETRLEEIRPLVRDQPNHPAYHSMILEAIRNLNGGMGSSEEEISNFMKKMHKNLPWAHTTFLKYHLNNLCGSAQVLINDEKLYTQSKDSYDKFITSQYRRKNYSKLGRPQMSSAVEEVRELKEDERMDVVGLEKPRRQPIILKLRFLSHNSDKTDVGMSCSDPNPKPLGHEELMVVPHPRIDEGKDPSLQLSEGPSIRPDERPPNHKPLADEFEALQLGGEEKHALLFSPSKESDVGTRTDVGNPAISTRIRSKRPPKCNLMDNGKPRMTQSMISELVPEGVIIALPALAAQVSQRDPRKGRVKM